GRTGHRPRGADLRRARRLHRHAAGALLPRGARLPHLRRAVGGAPHGHRAEPVAMTRRSTGGAHDGVSGAARPHRSLAHDRDDGGAMISDWVDVTQDLVDRFADVTGDRQWIHTDPTRGATIAHGFLTLS